MKTVVVVAVVAVCLISVRAVAHALRLAPRAGHGARVQVVPPDHDGRAQLAAGHGDRRALIWEGEPHPETQKELEAMGIVSVVFETAGNMPANGDFFDQIAQFTFAGKALHEIAG